MNAVNAIVNGTATPEHIQYFQDYMLANASARAEVTRLIEEPSQDPSLSEGRQRLMNRMAIMYDALQLARANNRPPNVMERDIEVSSTTSSSDSETLRRWLTSASPTSAARTRVVEAATETASSTGHETQRERTLGSTGRSRATSRYWGSSSASPARSASTSATAGAGLPENAATTPRGRGQRLVSVGVTRQTSGGIAQESKSPNAEHKAEASPSASARAVPAAMAGSSASAPRGEANIFRGGGSTTTTPTATTSRRAGSTPRITEIGMRTLTTPMRGTAAATYSPSRPSGRNISLGDPTPNASHDRSRRPPPRGT
jgi:hypothetical protein